MKDVIVDSEHPAAKDNTPPLTFVKLASRPHLRLAGKRIMTGASNALPVVALKQDGKPTCTKTTNLSAWGDRRFAVIGGAGFIGSHFVHNLLSDAAVESVTVYDNFSSGSEAHLKGVLDDARLLIVRGDVRDLENLKPAIAGFRNNHPSRIQSGYRESRHRSDGGFLGGHVPDP